MNALKSIHFQGLQMTFFHQILQDETWIAHDKVLHVTWLEEKRGRKPSNASAVVGML